MLQADSFVLFATLNQSFKKGVVPEGSRQLIMSDLATQLRQVLATKMIGKVRSGENELIFFELHDADQVVVSRRAIRRRVSKSGDFHHTDG